MHRYKGIISVKNYQNFQKICKVSYIMLASKFHRNHDKHISYSEKLSVEVEKKGQDVLNQIGNLDPKTSNQLFLKLINRIVGDTFKVVRDLQEIVIKCNPEEISTVDLKKVIKKLIGYCNEIVQEYDSAFGTLKEKFIILVKNIMLEAKDLLNIIKKDELHDFKHELVENLKEVLYTIHITQARMRIQNYTQQEITDTVKTIQKDYFDEIAQISNLGLEALNHVSLHIKHTTKHNYQLSYYLNKVASNYDDVDIQHKILESANLMNIANTKFLFESEKYSSAQDAIDSLKNASINCWNSLIGLLLFIENCHENKIVAENLKDIAMYVVSYGIVINGQLGKCIRHDDAIE